jgi:hypothetical protein
MTDATMAVDTSAVAKKDPARKPVDGVDAELVGRLVEQARAAGLQLTGDGGLLQQLTKRVVEAALDGEITDHLGYDKGDPAGNNGQNSRNGTRGETVLTEVGPVEITVPRDRDRDRDGSFEPQIVKKRQRRLSGVEDMVISLSAKRSTTGEIAAHLAAAYGADVSRQTISTITDKVVEGMTEWQNRPLDAALRLPRPSGSPSVVRVALTLSEVAMTRDEITRAVMVAKLARGLSWQDLADAVSKPVVWVAAALLGRYPLDPADAATLATKLGLPEGAAPILAAPTGRSLPTAVPTDPTISRVYAVLRVYEQG